MARSSRNKQTTSSTSVTEVDTTQDEITTEQEVEDTVVAPADPTEPANVQPEATPETNEPAVEVGLLAKLAARHSLTGTLPVLITSIDTLLDDYVVHMHNRYPQTDEGLQKYVNQLTQVFIMATNAADAPVSMLAMELITDYFREYNKTVFTSTLLLRLPRKMSRFTPVYGMYSTLCFYFTACAKLDDRRKISSEMSITRVLTAMMSDVQRNRISAFVS